jgi:hypothetical protein
VPAPLDSLPPVHPCRGAVDRDDFASQTHSQRANARVFFQVPYIMPKQKNHTARKNTRKAHRNGIKKIPNYRYQPTAGVSYSSL